MTTSPLKILFATPECAPLVKTGGLGDVSAALPVALRELGLDARVLLPGYPAVLAAVAGAPEAAAFEVLGQPVRLLDAKLPSGVPLLVVDAPKLYVRGGGPYQADDGDDWDDNALRFAVLSKVAAVLGSVSTPLDWHPDVVHCNDWPTALAPVYLRFDAGARAASLITIHNLAFQGNFDHTQVNDLGLAPETLTLNGLEFYGRMSFLKGAMLYADAINTVSPTYAREIQGEELGFGMDGVLRMRADRLYGVLNGIDTALWDPLHDPWIPNKYGPLTLERKSLNQRALRQRMGLDASEKPILGMVTRLTHQKGLDLVAAAADGLLALGAQVAVVGTGDRALVEQLEIAQSRHPGDFAVFIGFDEELAHLVEAGADAFLMPSRFEPCGMNQMYSQRYGTPPIVHSTGGLADTVSDGDPKIQTGFLMPQATVPALLGACRRALATMREPKQWRTIQLHGMAKDFGWESAARKYREIYEKINGVRVN